MDREDQQLIVDYLNGQEEALSPLISRHLKSVYSYLWRITGSSPDLDDLTQEVFIKAWKSLKSFKTGQSFKAWLFAIARNTAIDHLRKKKLISFSAFDGLDGGNVLEETLVDPEPLPDEVFSRIQDSAELDRLLSCLSAQQREIIVLHYHQELTFDEISTIVAKPLNTVKSSHRRALIALRKMAKGPEIKLL